MSFYKTTEQQSNYTNLENKSTLNIITEINKEDQTIALSINKNLIKIELVINKVYESISKGGRLFYIGSGTSGRLGVLDASECPPTFGVNNDLVVAIIAGGDKAIRNSQEYAEDSLDQGWLDLKKKNISKNDFVIGIAASGTTPYVLGAIKYCNKNNIQTGCITCNKNSPLSQVAKFPIEIVVGPEYLTGSSRMKAGTAQKMVLNMITTTTMIKLGRVKNNLMVDMQLSNEKLIDRGIRIVKEELKITSEQARKLIKKTNSVRQAIDLFKKK